MFCAVPNLRPFMCILLTFIIILQDTSLSFGYDNASSKASSGPRRTRSLSSISDTSFILMNTYRRLSLDTVVVFEELPARWNFPMIGEAVTFCLDAFCYREALGMLIIVAMLIICSSFALLSIHRDSLIAFY